MRTGIIIFAHGSRIEAANEAVRAVAAEVARTGGYELLEAAFLELGTPDLGGAVERLMSQGAERIVVIPYFLTLGIHLERDLPRIAQRLARIHNIEIEVTAPLDPHPLLATIVLGRVRQALGDSEDLR